MILLSGRTGFGREEFSKVDLGVRIEGEARVLGGAEGARGLSLSQRG